MKKMKIQQFIGRQLARLKAGQSLYSIIIQTITVLGIIKMALPGIDFWTLGLLFPIAILGALMIGFFMDKSDVITADHMKTIEMTHRYLNTADFKTNEFRMVQMRAFFEWMKAIQNNEPMDFDKLNKEYNKFIKKWNPPKENKGSK